MCGDGDFSRISRMDESARQTGKRLLSELGRIRGISNTILWKTGRAERAAEEAKRDAERTAQEAAARAKREARERAAADRKAKADEKKRAAEERKAKAATKKEAAAKKKTAPKREATPVVKREPIRRSSSGLSRTELWQRRKDRYIQAWGKIVRGLPEGTDPISGIAAAAGITVKQVESALDGYGIRGKLGIPPKKKGVKEKIARQIWIKRFTILNEELKKRFPEGTPNTAKNLAKVSAVLNKETEGEFPEVSAEAIENAVTNHKMRKECSHLVTAEDKVSFEKEIPKRAKEIEFIDITFTGLREYWKRLSLRGIEGKALIFELKAHSAKTKGLIRFINIYAKKKNGRKTLVNTIHLEEGRPALVESAEDGRYDIIEALKAQWEPLALPTSRNSFKLGDKTVTYHEWLKKRKHPAKSIVVMRCLYVAKGTPCIRVQNKHDTNLKTARWAQFAIGRDGTIPGLNPGEETIDLRDLIARSSDEPKKTQWKPSKKQIKVRIGKLFIPAESLNSYWNYLVEKLGVKDISGLEFSIGEKSVNIKPVLSSGRTGKILHRLILDENDWVAGVGKKRKRPWEVTLLPALEEQGAPMVVFLDKRRRIRIDGKDYPFRNYFKNTGRTPDEVRITRQRQENGQYEIQVRKKTDGVKMGKVIDGTHSITLDKNGRPVGVKLKRGKKTIDFWEVLIEQNEDILSKYPAASAERICTSDTTSISIGPVEYSEIKEYFKYLQRTGFTKLEKIKLTKHENEIEVVALLKNKGQKLKPRKLAVLKLDKKGYPVGTKINKRAKGPGISLKKVIELQGYPVELSVAPNKGTFHLGLHGLICALGSFLRDRGLKASQIRVLRYTGSAKPRRIEIRKRTKTNTSRPEKLLATIYLDNKNYPLGFSKGKKSFTFLNLLKHKKQKEMQKLKGGAIRRGAPAVLAIGEGSFLLSNLWVVLTFSLTLAVSVAALLIYVHYVKVYRTKEAGSLRGFTAKNRAPLERVYKPLAKNTPLPERRFGFIKTVFNAFFLPIFALLVNFALVLYVVYFDIALISSEIMVYALPLLLVSFLAPVMAGMSRISKLLAKKIKHLKDRVLREANYLEKDALKRKDRTLIKGFKRVNGFHIMSQKGYPGVLQGGRNLKERTILLTKETLISRQAIRYLTVRRSLAFYYYDTVSTILKGKKNFFWIAWTRLFWEIYANFELLKRWYYYPLLAPYIIAHAMLFNFAALTILIPMSIIGLFKMFFAENRRIFASIFRAFIQHKDRPEEDSKPPPKKEKKRSKGSKKNDDRGKKGIITSTPVVIAVGGFSGVSTVILAGTIGLLAVYGVLKWMHYTGRLKKLAEKYPTLDKILHILFGMNPEEKEIAEILYRNAPVPFHTLDHEGKIIMVNPKWLETFGYKMNEVIGKSIFDFIVPEQRENAKKRFKARIRRWQLRRLLAEGDLSREQRRALQEESERYRYLPPRVDNNSKEYKDRIYLRKNGQRIIAETDDTVTETKILTSLRDITDQRRLEDELKEAACCDPLTDLYNIRYFRKKLEEVLKDAERDSQEVSVLLFNLDTFESIKNDSGISFTTDLLHEMGKKIKACIKAEPTENPIKLYNPAHIDGGLFALIVPASEEESARERTERIAKMIRDKLKEKVFVERHPYQYRGSISMGAALFSEDAENAKDLIHYADVARQHAKKQEENSLAFCFSELKVKDLTQRQIANRLPRVLDNMDANGFFAHYEIQRNPKTDRIEGLEAYVRWDDPELVPLLGRDKPLQPLEFIPLAEERGWIGNITKYMLRKACTQIKAWQRDLGYSVPVSVNTTAYDFQMMDLVEIVKKILDETGLDLEANPGLLKLEITERMPLNDLKRAISTMKKLCELGVVIDIDDFGTGESSLSMLNRIPYDELKLDAGFMKNIAKGLSKLKEEDIDIIPVIGYLTSGTDKRKLPEGVKTKEQLDVLKELQADIDIISMIIDFAHKPSIDKKVIAEFVDREELVILLRALGCDLAQGYVRNGHPKSAEETAEMLREQGPDDASPPRTQIPLSAVFLDDIKQDIAFEKQGKKVHFPEDMLLRLKRMAELRRELNVELVARCRVENGSVVDVEIPADKKRIAVLIADLPEDEIVNSYDYFGDTALKFAGLKHYLRTLDPHQSLSEDESRALLVHFDALKEEMTKYKVTINLYIPSSRQRLNLTADNIEKIALPELSEALSSAEWFATEWCGAKNLEREYELGPDGVTWTPGPYIDESLIKIHSHPVDHPEPPSGYMYQDRRMGDIYLPGFFNGQISGLILDVDGRDELFLFYETDIKREKVYTDMFRKYCSGQSILEDLRQEAMTPKVMEREIKPTGPETEIPSAFAAVDVAAPDKESGDADLKSLLLKLADAKLMSIAMVDAILTKTLNKKLVLAFDRSMGGAEKAKLFGVFESLKNLKKDPRYAKILKNLIIVTGSPEKLHNKLQRYFGKQNTEIFLFANAAEMERLEKLSSIANVKSVYVDESQLPFPFRSYYPLAEIVTITLIQSIDPFISETEPITAITMGDGKLELKEINIKSISMDNNTLIFKILPNAKPLETQKLIKTYAELKYLLKSA
jgi:diguanylate cyclase (GGDEF)-like protein